MDDYIRRDAVIKWVESWLNMDRYFRPNGEHDGIPITELYALLKRIHAADAVRVVRCRDCIHNYANMVPGGEGCAKCTELPIAPDFFCKIGERKGGDK